MPAWASGDLPVVGSVDGGDLGLRGSLEELPEFSQWFLQQIPEGQLLAVGSEGVQDFAISGEHSRQAVCFSAGGHSDEYFRQIGEFDVVFFDEAEH